jgi:hypothetical protein
MDEKNDQTAHHRIAAGREILRNHGRNNNSPATRVRIHDCRCSAAINLLAAGVGSGMPTSRRRRLRLNKICPTDPEIGWGFCLCGSIPKRCGAVVQSVSTSALQAGDYGFESRPRYQFSWNIAFDSRYRYQIFKKPDYSVVHARGDRSNGWCFARDGFADVRRIQAEETDTGEGILAYRRHPCCTGESRSAVVDSRLTRP